MNDNDVPHTPAPGKETSDHEFFMARVALTIASSRVEATKHRYPFNQYTERTTEEASAGDATEAMRHIDTREEAAKFLAGYTDYLVLSGAFGPDKAKEVARENLRYGAGKTFSTGPLMDLWDPVLREEP